MENCEEVLKTELQRGVSNELLEKRVKRIQEALSFPSGTKEAPAKIEISVLSNGKEVFFLKPGKEVFRKKNPNLNDMMPIVGEPDNMLSFDQIFEIILKVSLFDIDSFKKLLVLIYRLAYMLDCEENENERIRYLPSNEMSGCINDLDGKIKTFFPDYDLWGLLSFLDLLGWNEDDKYHIQDGQTIFGEKHAFNVGRINTLLTCIGVPYMAYEFVEHVLENKDNPQNINHEILMDIVQKLLKSRGICPPTQEEVLKWLGPYVCKLSKKSKLTFK